MTQKILVIGNSHVGALKDGWDALPRRQKQADVTFFCAPQEIYRDMRWRNAEFGYWGNDEKKIRMLDLINGTNAIDPSGYDAHVRVGDHTRLLAFHTLLARCDIDGLRQNGLPTRLSRKAFDLICQELAQERPKDWFATKPSTTKTWALLPPFVPEKAIGQEDGDLTLMETILKNPQGYRAARDIYFAALRAVFASKSITLLDQPAETLTESGISQDRYFHASKRLMDGQVFKKGKGDLTHANADYGKLVWAHLFDALKPA